MENVKLPKVALGAWSWGTGAAGGDQVFGNRLTQDELKVVFDRAIEMGLNLWDTAAVYGMGASEEMLGAFIKDCASKVVLSTKFTPQIADGSANAVKNMLDGSKKRLNADFIDIYWIHNPADVERWTPYLPELVKSGAVGAVGVSNHNLAQIKRAEAILGEQGIKLSAVQNHYSLLNRSSERGGILDYCKANGITFYAYMVLEQGALTGRYGAGNPFPSGSDRARSYNPILDKLQALIDEMRLIGGRYNISPAQIATAWAIAKGTLPIIGVTKPTQVEAAAQAAAVTLSADEIAALEQVAAKIDVSTIREWERPMD